MANIPTLDFRVEGIITLKTFKVDSEGRTRGRPTKTRKFHNMVLNNGLSRWASGASGAINWCRVGSGSTAPVATDTQLQSQVSSTNSVTFTQGVSAGAPWYGWTRGVYTFAVGTAAGVLSEVGFGWSNTGATLFSRALITDGGGTPTTITVLSDEILQVTYEVRLYSPTADVTGTYTFGGTDYAWTLRAANANNSNMWSYMNGLVNITSSYISTYKGGATLGATTSNPTGTKMPIEYPSTTTMVYATGGATYCDVVMDYLLDRANDPLGIGAIYAYANAGSGYMGGGWQILFNPALPKTAARTLKVTLRLNFSRYP